MTKEYNLMRQHREEHTGSGQQNMHQTWSDIQITVEHVVAEDNWVMGRSVATATHSKVVLGVPPTNKQIETTFWDLHHFNENGLIIETWTV
jgi:predicted ester cyclase